MGTSAEEKKAVRKAEMSCNITGSLRAFVKNRKEKNFYPDDWKERRILLFCFSLW